MTIINATNDIPSKEVEIESPSIARPKSKVRRFFGVLSIVEILALAVLAIGAVILFSLLIQVMGAGPVILTPGSTLIGTPPAP